MRICLIVMSFVLLVLGHAEAVAQTIVDVNQEPLNFDQPSVLDQGSNSGGGDDDDDDDDDDNASAGTIGEGAVLLYENVYQTSDLSFDALVTFVAISGGVCSDYDNTSSTQNNIPRWFSPRFTWGSSGGEAEIEIAFIASGTVDNPEPVTFNGFLLNSYDLDGGTIASGAAGQFTDLEAFESYTLGENSTLDVSEVNGYTRFQSAFNQSTDADSDETRVYVRFGEVSTMTVRLGASGSGLAYYFLDFSEGLTWTTVPDPEVDEIEAGCEGADILVEGDFLEDVDAVSIGGIDVASYVTLSDNQISLTIPMGLSAGLVDLTLEAYGQTYSYSGLEILAIDECGVCGGAGILEGACDCEGNAPDECGVCGGSGAVYECGCSDVPEGDCDCDGNVLDECGLCGGEGARAWYADVDGDGKGDCDDVLESCAQPEGYVEECGDGCPNDPAKFDPGFCGCGKVEFFAHGDVICAEICCPDGDCPGPEDLCGFGTVWDPECQQCICAGPSCYGDLNLDGIIQLNDLLDLLGVYGTTCPED